MHVKKFYDLGPLCGNLTSVEFEVTGVLILNSSLVTHINLDKFYLSLDSSWVVVSEWRGLYS